MTQDSDTPSENEIELWDDETEPSEEDIEIFTAAGEKLRERCESSDVEFSVDDYGGEFDQSFVLQFPSGRDSRSVSIDDVDDANLFLANEFEDINFIKPYNAYCSYEKGIILASIEPIGRGLSGYSRRRGHALLRAISPNDNGGDEKELGFELVLNSTTSSPKMEIDRASQFHASIVG